VGLALGFESPRREPWAGRIPPARRIRKSKVRGVSADTALRLERYFGSEAKGWLNLQARTFRNSASNKFMKALIFALGSRLEV